jgi:hypothetical protein
MATPTIKPSANISILWGTKNAANGPNANAAPSGMLLETLSFTPKHGEPVDIEDGDGIAAIQVHPGYDGGAFRATGVYDQNKAMPVEGDNITVVMPKRDGNINTTNVNCSFWSWSFTRTRKKEATVELIFTHRPSINT